MLCGWILEIVSCYIISPHDGTFFFSKTNKTSTLINFKSLNLLYFQNLTSDIPVCTTESPTSKPGSVFALTQFFCHTCHMITLIPGDVTDQLFVLALDLLGRVEEMLPSNQQENELEWTNQKRAMEIVIKNIGDSEQRQTLMQKLSGLSWLVNFVTYAYWSPILQFSMFINWAFHTLPCFKLLFFSTLRGYSTPNQKLACFVRYLKLSTPFRNMIYAS